MKHRIKKIRLWYTSLERGIKEKKRVQSIAGVSLVCIGLIFLLVTFLQSNNAILPNTDEQRLLHFDTDVARAEEVSNLYDSPYHIRIPKIGVDMPIVVGESSEDEALQKGAWLIPGSEVPWERNGYNNTVISAHRYLYTSGPRTFFRLDELERGDEIVIDADGVLQRYRVDRIHIVEPDAIEILESSDEHILTLFTCHPVFTTDERLVVIARPVE